MANTICAVLLTALIFSSSSLAQEFPESGSGDNPFFCPDYGTFKCQHSPDLLDFSCISYSRVCDNTTDCYDNADESICGDCDVGYIGCPNTTICISNTQACNGAEDCPDGCDESTDSCGCPDEGQVPVCRNALGQSYCLNESSLCDGVYDCAYGEDESYPYCTTVCSPDQISCSDNESLVCIEVYQLCNGVFECPNGLDEGNCNVTIIPESQFCPYGLFTCSNGLDGVDCISYSRVCDGVNDCYNGTDESSCGDCEVGNILCPNNSMCMNNTLACNGVMDCDDGTDESVDVCGCPAEGEVPVCSNEEGERYCISESYLCNGVPDCAYGEDESSPYCSDVIFCDYEQATCMETGSCVNISDVCEGYVDCPSLYSAFCDTGPSVPTFCPYGTFSCSSNSNNTCSDDCCISYTSVCDGVMDCLYGYDEAPEICGICPEGDILCPGSSTCVNSTLFCDGNYDCTNGTDESVLVCGCSEPDYYPVCGTSTMSDSERTCLNSSLICNGIPDCPYGEDESEIYCPVVDACEQSPCEQGCNSTAEGYLCYCLEGYRLVNNTQCEDINECLEAALYGLQLCPPPLVCYNLIGGFSCGCPEGTSLVNSTCVTPGRCPSGFVSCATNIPGTPDCVPYSNVCDGISDCFDQSDENSCCTLGIFNCSMSNECISTINLCNNFTDCLYGDDESICDLPAGPTDLPPTQGPGCPPGEVMCLDTSGQCAQLCNGIIECSDGLDESPAICGMNVTGPPGVYTCPEGFVPCATDVPDTPGCIFRYQFCDGVMDCADQSDETSCNGCSSGEFWCPASNFCLPNSELCNFVPDCAFNEDESICIRDPQPPAACPPGSYPCGIDPLAGCWTESQACDGVNDCGDSLAWDEIGGFVALVTNGNVTCDQSGSGFGSGTGLDGLVIGVVLPPVMSVPVLEGTPSFPVCFVRGGTSSDESFTIAVTTSEINSTSNVDYEELQELLFFAPSDTILCFTITILDDEIVEGIENFVVRAGVVADVNYTFVGPTSVELSIVDNDGVSVEVVVPLQNFTETEEQDVVLCLEFLDEEIILERNATFDVTLFAISPYVTEGVDYERLAYNITIPPGNYSYSQPGICVSIATILDDDLIEQLETLSGYVRPLMFPDNVQTSETNMTTIGGSVEISFNIISDDVAEFIVVNGTDQRAVDEGGSYQLCLEPQFNISNLEGYFTIKFNITRYTTDYDDVSMFSREVIIDRFSSFPQYCARVFVNPDSFIEYDEIFIVTMETEYPVFINGSLEVPFIIIDDDFAILNSEFSEYYVEDESGWPRVPISLCVSLVPDPFFGSVLQRSVTVVFSVISSNASNAVEDEDFLIFGERFGVIEPSEMGVVSDNNSVCVDVAILNDRVIENTEYITMVVSTLNEGDTINGPNKTTIQITDNDYLVVELLSVVAIEGEMAEFSVILVDVGEGLARDVPITFTVSTPGLIEKRQERFEFLEQGTYTATVYANSPNGTVVNVTLPVLDDTVLTDHSRQYQVDITPNNALDYLVEGRPFAEFVIQDDEMSTIFLQTDQISISESEEKFNVTLMILSPPRQRNVVIDISIILYNGTTADDVSYPTEAIFSPLEDSISVCFQVLMEDAVGLDRNFAIVFTPTNEQDLIRGSNVVNVTVENAGAMLSLTSATYMVMEGGQVEVCVYHANHTLETDVTFTLTLSDDTTEGYEIDYLFADERAVSNQLTLTFSASEDMYMICTVILPIDDGIAEYTESLNVTLSADSEHTINIGMATISIMDNDGVILDAGDVSVVETDADQMVSACVTMTTPEGTERDVVITLSQIHKQGEDGPTNVSEIYDPLLFPPSPLTSRTLCQNITVMGNDYIENDRVNQLIYETMYSLDAVASNLTADLTIEDDDGAYISFGEVERIVEGDEDQIVQLPFTVTGELRRTVVFTVSIEDSAEVSISGGQLSTNTAGTLYVNLTVTGDVIVEGEETFGITIATENPLDTFEQELSVSVVDNDYATVEISHEFSDEVLEGTPLEVCAFLTPVDFERIISVNVVTIPGNEAGRVDQPNVVTFNFEPGTESNELCTFFTFLNDSQIETDGLLIIESSSPSGDTVTGATNISVTIVDDDGAELVLGTNKVTLFEGDLERSSAQVCVELVTYPGNVSRPIVVSAEARFSSSTDMDIFSFDTEVTINVTETAACFQVSLGDDEVYNSEPRNISLLFSPINGLDYFPAGYDVVVVIIYDDDTPLVMNEDYTPFVDLFEDDGAELVAMRNTDDGCSDQVYNSVGIPIGSSIETTLRVCSNGIISFGSGHFSFYFSQRFPSALPQVQRSNVLAPLWNDYDPTSDISNVFYKSYFLGRDPSGDAKIKSVSQFISSQKETSFEGMWMFVAEWNRVPPFPSSGEEDQEANTFQAIVITDNVLTYAVYTYSCDQLEWVETPSGNYHVVGYNIAPENSARFDDPFMNHPLSTFPQIGNIACSNNGLRVDTSNLVYFIGNSSAESQLLRGECLKRANIDREQFGYSINYNNPCPCSWFQVTRDNRYGFISSFLERSTGDSRFSDSLCYVDQFPPFFGSGLQMCCYDNFFGSLLPSSPAVGFPGSSYLRFHPYFDFNDYFQYDYQFKEICCEQAGICEEYTNLRPYDSCFFYRPPRRSWCWGDPHLTTLDDGVFTFNGWGEYTLMEFNTNTTQFLLQGRTKPFNGTTATQLVSFAFAMVTEMNVEVMVKEGTETEMTVLVSGVDVSSNLTNVNDTYILPRLTVTRNSENRVTASFPNGVAVQSTASFGMLSLVLTVPEAFRNITRGLMGNFNGDKMDDVVFRNGTMLDLPVRDSVIHQVGQSWEIRPQDSLFMYPEGLSPLNFSFPEHTPIFLDDVLDSASNETKAICNNDPQCIFDLDQTGNMDIAMDTLNTNMDNINDQILASNNPPRITGPSFLRLDLGMTSLLVFNVSDDSDNYTVTLVNGLPGGAMLDYTSQDGGSTREYTFTWVLDEVVTRGLMFEAVDELAAASILDVQVQICPCLNEGNCTIEGISNIDSDNIVLNCECSEAWEGDTCEIDVNGCDEITCFPGVDCTDVAAPGIGATCGACPDGYFGDGQKCEDVNECNGTAHGCMQTCRNLAGSFECLCEPGYQLGADSTSCSNINECEMLNGECHQICMDNIGSFVCSCDHGYELNADNRTCTVLASAMCPEDNSCSQDCVLLNAQEVCSCEPGYQLASDNYTCNDVDECLQSPCHQECENTVGGFTCLCRAGYAMMDGVCEDVNECVNAALSDQQLCPSPMVCNNLPGDFSCDCPDGTFLMDSMCLMPTTAPPTTPPPATVPTEFTENIVEVTIPNLTAAEFTEELQTLFRMTTADAINTYCMENSCLHSRKRQSTVVTADDVVIVNVRDENGELVFDVYVTLPTGGAVPAVTVVGSIEENEASFTAADPSFVLEVRATTTTAPEPVGLTTEQIVGIAIGCGLGALLILALVIVAVVCCVRYRSSRMKSFNLHESYGLDYDNPVAANDEIEEVTVRTLEKEEKPNLEEPPEPMAAANIYVNPGQIENEPEIEVVTEMDDKSGGAMQSLILKFGDPDDESLHSKGKDELTSL